MRQTVISLTKKDEEILEDIRSRGIHSSREICRANILLALNKGIPEKHLIDVLGVSRPTIWAVRKAYNDGGIENSIYDAPRTGKPVQHDDNVKAKITALACSKAPEGRARWTVRLLTDEANKGQNLEKTISRETIRRILKKNNLSLG
jgi:transposase